MFNKEMICPVVINKAFGFVKDDSWWYSWTGDGRQVIDET